MWKRDTVYGVYLLSTSWAAAGLADVKPPEHALVDLACPNGQRYMVHFVESYDSTAPNLSTFTAGVCNQNAEGTAVEDILRLAEEGLCTPDVSCAFWPTTSADGCIRLELSGPRGNLSEFVVPRKHYWELKIVVSLEEAAA